MRITPRVCTSVLSFHCTSVLSLCIELLFILRICVSSYIYSYLYCVYALVGGAISIRDPYICSVSRVCANESHAVFHGPLSVQLKRSYRLHDSIEAYLVGKKALGRRSCSR